MKHLDDKTSVDAETSADEDHDVQVLAVEQLARARQL